MSADQPQPRIACSLEPEERTDRRAVWQQLAKRALRERRLIPGGVQLVFDVRGGVEGRLRELARLEGQCCSFADWRACRGEGGIVLDVTAPPDAVAAVRALFDGPVQAGEPAR